MRSEAISSSVQSNWPILKWSKNVLVELVTTRVISAPRFSVDNVAYDCPITGKWIGSKHEHEENLKQHGCRVYEPGETEQTKQLKAREEAEFDKKIDDTVEREIDQMSSDKKEKLANELLGGADLAVERN
jgi:hypothetical protein